MPPIRSSLPSHAALAGVLTTSLFACGGDDSSGPSETAVQVNVVTTGSPADPDGYSVSIDAGTPQSIGVNGSVTFEDLASGGHTVLLTGLAANCTAESENPRTVNVDAGETAETTFNVNCAANAGSIAVITETTGEDLDPDGYAISIDGGASQAVPASGTTTIPGITAGTHSVTVGGLALNCTLAEGIENPQTITVEAEATSEVVFVISCANSPTAVAGRIAFTLPAEQVDIAAVNPDGTEIVNLTNDEPGDAHPSWSPDGTKIAFNTNRDGGGIAVMNADGSDITLIHADPNAGGPDWSPDGTRIVFAVEKGGTDCCDFSYFIMDADGTNVELLLDDPDLEFEGPPSWSPEGSLIAFHAEPVGTDDSNIYVVDVASGAVAPVYEGGAAAYPDFSPDGGHIAVQLFEGGIGVMNTDGSGLVNVAPGVSAEEPSWSPDGTAIAYSTNLDIWVMNADGSQQTQITQLSELAVNSPSWGLPTE